MCGQTPLQCDISGTQPCIINIRSDDDDCVGEDDGDIDDDDGDNDEHDDGDDQET